MAYCSNCGQPLQDGAKFCSSCGTTPLGAQLTSGSAPATAPAPVRVVVVETRKGDRLAFKGFLTSFILAIIFGAATKNDGSAHSVVIVIAFGVGAAYIISNLLKWKRNNDVVQGGGIGWTVAVLLLLICVGGLVNAGTGGSSTGNSVSLPTPAPAIDPRDALLRDVKLEYKWRKEGFGNVMVADFTVKNPTQYRFKDFEIKCTHLAPSGTEIDSNRRTIYEVVEPKSTKVIKQMNMGFIHSQAARSGCEITDLVVVQ